MVLPCKLDGGQQVGVCEMTRGIDDGDLKSRYCSCASTCLGALLPPEDASGCFFKGGTSSSNISWTSSFTRRRLAHRYFTDRNEGPSLEPRTRGAMVCSDDRQGGDWMRILMRQLLYHRLTDWRTVTDNGQICMAVARLLLQCWCW